MTDRTVVYRIQADVKQAQAQMAALGASVKKSADDMSGASKESQKFRAGLTDLGGAAGKVGLVAAAGLGAAVMTAANFDQAMSKVEAATMESAAGMGRLREAALQAGADTAFSASEAADGIEQLAKAGVSTSDILGGGLAGALDLAAAGTIDVGVASEIAATTMNQFGLAGSEVSHIADVLAASAGKAMGEVTDMAAALKYVGPVAAQMGISLEETAGTIAYLASQGILGEQAGTSLRGMLTGLTSPSKIAADEMARLGINMYDAQGEFIGLDGLAGQLQGSMSELGAAERDAALGRIFGNEQITAARILYAGGSEAVSKWTDEVNDSGFAAEVAALKLDNLKGDLEALGGSLETALINTGDGAQGPLRTLTQGLTGVINKYNDLPPAAQNASAAFLGVTAVAGGGVWAFAKAVDGISSVRETLTNLGTSSDGVKGKLKSVASFVGGPWGLAFIGAGLLLNDYMAQQAKTEGYVDSLTAALDDQTGAMTRQTIATNLQDEGWLEYAESLGVGSDVVIDAALGSAEAMEILKEAADGVSKFDIGDSFTGDSEQLIENVEAQAEAQKQAQKNAELLAAANGDMGESATGAASATEGLTGATKRLGGASYQTAEQAKAEADALADAQKAAQSTAGAFVNLGDSLNDATVSLGGWIRQMANQADALNNFTANAQRAANKGLRDGLIAALKEAGPEGAMRMKQLANATESEIARANGAWSKGQQAINRYVDATTKVPADKSTKLTLDDQGAAQKLAAYKNSLEALRDRNLTITTVYKVVGNATDALPARANGGPIYGPGTKTSDSIPAMLSTGEYVIKAAAVDHYGLGFFDQANSMRLAGGGSPDKKRRKGKVGSDDSMESTNDNSIWDQRMFNMLQASEQAAQRQENAAQISLTAAEDQAKAAEDNLSAAESQLSATQQLSASFAGSVSSQFSNSLTGGGLAGLSRTLSQDIAGGAAFQSTLDALIANGLDTTGASAGLFQELAASGDLTTANQLLAAGPDAIAQYEAMFAQREAQNLSRGEMAAQASYGEMIAQQTATVAAAEAQVVQLQAVVAQREAQHAQSTAQIQALTAAVQEQATQIGNVINNTATSAAQSRPRGVSQAGSWR